MWTIVLIVIDFISTGFALVFKRLCPKMNSKLPTVQYLKKLYEENKGIRELYKFKWNTKPAVLLTDLDLIKTVLIKEFESFERRDDFFDERDEFKSSHLANVYGNKWKLLRKHLSKAFNSCAMEELICNFKDFYWNSSYNIIDKEKGDVVLNEFVYLSSLYGIMEVAFSVESLNIAKSAYMFLFSSLRKKVNEKQFFLQKVEEFEEIRREKKTPDKNFFKILLELKSENQISLLDVAAQTYVFCSAGTESVALSVQYCLYELAMHVDIQNRLRNEVTDVLYNNNDIVTKKALSEMVFLNCCFKETLRKYTIGTMLKRLCSKSYQTTNGNIIEKGSFVIIPMEAIHKDPRIYTNPEEYNPDRFMEKQFHQMAFLAFGNGPRGCIGAKFGEIQTKMILVRLLSLCKFSMCKKTVVPIVMDPNSKFIKPLNEIVLNVEKI